MIFKTIAELIAEHIDCDPSEIKMETTFESLGIDSLDTVEMVMELEVVWASSWIWTGRSPRSANWWPLRKKRTPTSNLRESL